MTLEAAAENAELLAAGALAAGAQENIAIAGKYFHDSAPGYRKTRDWQLFFFFRVLSHQEADRISGATVLSTKDLPEERERPPPLDVELLNPGLYSLPKLMKTPRRIKTNEARSGEKFDGHPAPTAAARQFRDWLKIVSGASKPDSAPSVDFQNFLQPAVGKRAGKSAAGQPGEPIIPKNVLAFADRVSPIANDLKAIAARLERQNPTTAIPETGSRVIEQGLISVVAYEFLRQAWRASRGGAVGALAAGRPQDSPPADADARTRPLARPFGLHFDPASINIAMTFKGLEQLGLDPTVLRSFPDAFRDGMAARAVRLSDTGPSAPETWYGELGSSRIHGYFTGGFAAPGATEAAWKKLRKEIDLFNTRKPEAVTLRLALQLLFGFHGMELMHVELGQAPYIVDSANKPVSINPRIEHFGFRDGVSQPFVDMKVAADGSMAPPPPGGATPGRNRTWTPLATGELYLGFPDEDGNRVEQPANRLLRDAGTYIVFRKLAQDVVGFRNFLRAQRPGSKQDQEYLAAQMVGRWKSGASLVVAPTADLWTDDERLNDFRYAGDDPRGERCPLSAHVRRVNPRDIGGRNEVRRHRLMRRSMAYGGAILPEESPGDGEERGLLFVAANSRIDMQFEVVQGDWLNRGEFLGQAGLGKCPLAGANNGSVHDAFLEAKRGVPVTGLPPFVMLRGGDYFFAPSFRALQELANGNAFTAEPDLIVDDGHSFGDVRTEELFSEARIAPLALEVAFGDKGAKGFRMPPAEYGQADYGGARPTEDNLVWRDVVFVRSYGDVTKVLSSMPDEDGNVAYTAAHSRIAGRRMLGRGNLLVGTDWGGDTAGDRKTMLEILRKAWGDKPGYWHAQLERIVHQSLRDATARVARSGRIDLVRDFAADATFRVVTELMGVATPGRLTELAMAIPFGRPHVGQVHPDWLSSHAVQADENPGLVTLKTWSFLVGLNLIADYKLQKPVVALGQQAAGEALLHIDALIARARERRPDASPTLLSRLVAVEQEVGIEPGKYYDYVRSLLFELALTASAIIPAAFGVLMDASFRFGIDLSTIVPALEKASPGRGVQHLIYEINRLGPALPLVIRLCEKVNAAPLPSGARIRNKQWVAALVAGANLDPCAFKDPLTFSLNPSLPGGAERDVTRYLMFGVQNAGEEDPGPRTCWGRDTIALFTLVNCVRAASRLPGLRRVPGPGGELRRMLGIASGLTARFASFTPG